MSGRNENARTQARATLRQETPIADEAGLLPWQDEVAAIVREAERRDPSGERVSTLIDEIARSYFRHALHRR